MCTGPELGSGCVVSGVEEMIVLARVGSETSTGARIGLGFVTRWLVNDKGVVVAGLGSGTHGLLLSSRSALRTLPDGSVGALSNSSEGAFVSAVRPQKDLDLAWIDHHNSKAQRAE